MYLGLEAGVEGGEEGMAGRQRQDSSLRHRTLDVVVLYYHIFLEDFHGVHLVCAFLFSKHHLSDTYTRTLIGHCYYHQRPYKTTTFTNGHSRCSCRNLVTKIKKSTTSSRRPYFAETAFAEDFDEVEMCEGESVATVLLS